MNHKEFRSTKNDIKKAKNILKNPSQGLDDNNNLVEFANIIDDSTTMGGLKTRKLVEVGEKMLIDEYNQKKKNH